MKPRSATKPKRCDDMNRSGATIIKSVEDASLIKGLHVLSSGWGEQHKEHRFGSWKPTLLWVLTSRSWVPLPLHYFLIEHIDGPILFDTGLDPAIASDPEYIKQAIGRFLLKRIFKLHITEDDALDRVLAKAGFSAGDIRTAVISHLHFDHVGGIAHIPQADLIVSTLERAQLFEPHPEYEWILRDHIEIPGAHWHPFEFASTDDPLFEGFDGIFDVAGDGSMILLPTPGHTVGSLSMLIRREGWKPILLAGDVAYDADLITAGRVPGTGEAETLRATYAKINALKTRLPDLVIAPSHDPTTADKTADATRTEVL